MRSLVVIYLYLLFGPVHLLSPVQAESLYPQMVRDSEPDVEAIKKAAERLKDHKEIEIIDDLSVAPFHRRAAVKESEKRPICRSCHQRLPHAKSERSRTFLNMHSRFIACESCHLQPEGMVFDYRWVAFSEPRMGERIDATVSVHTLADREITSIVPRPGARIVPFKGDQPAYTFADHPFAVEVEDRWREGSEEEKTALHAQLHEPLNAEGRKCRACHSDRDSILDLQQLGASKRQQRAITHNVVTRFFERYQGDDERLRLTDLLR